MEHDIHDRGGFENGCKGGKGSADPMDDIALDMNINGVCNGPSHATSSSTGASATCTELTLTRSSSDQLKRRTPHSPHNFGLEAGEHVPPATVVGQPSVHLDKEAADRDFEAAMQAAKVRNMRNKATAVFRDPGPKLDEHEEEEDLVVFEASVPTPVPEEP